MLDIRRDPPTARREAINVLLTTSASKGVSFVDQDIDRVLYCWPPKNGPPLPEVQPGSLLHVLKRVIRCTSQMVGSSIVHATVFRGCVICLHVDDMLGTGDVVFESKLKELDKLVGFGSMKRQKFEHCGRLCEKHASGDITISMKAYIQNLRKTSLTLERTEQVDDELSASESDEFRGINGCLQNVWQWTSTVCSRCLRQTLPPRAGPRQTRRTSWLRVLHEVASVIGLHWCLCVAAAVAAVAAFVAVVAVAAIVVAFSSARQCAECFHCVFFLFCLFTISRLCLFGCTLGPLDPITVASLLGCTCGCSPDSAPSPGAPHAGSVDSDPPRFSPSCDVAVRHVMVLVRAVSSPPFSFSLQRIPLAFFLFLRLRALLAPFPVFFLAHSLRLRLLLLPF